VPDAVIARRPDVLERQGLVRALDLLKAQGVRLLLLQILDEPRQPRPDAVEVVGDDLHGEALASARQDTEVRAIAGAARR
jgi:hypothetical protein